MNASRKPLRARPGRWTGAHACVAGLRHVAARMPCQDAAISEESPIPFVAVCDGRGSSKHSQHGSTAAVAVLRSVFQKHSGRLKELLGHGSCHCQRRVEAWNTFLYQHCFPALQEAQFAAALEHGVPAHDLEYTLSAAILGRRHLGWVQVGDSGLLAIRRGVPRFLCEPQRGEFANETQFVSTGIIGLRLAESGLASLRECRAVIAMSDGAGAGFWEGRGQTPGLSCAQLATSLTRAGGSSQVLSTILQNPSWNRITDDDRSIATLVRSN